jgi:hypothetical protein
MRVTVCALIAVDVFAYVRTCTHWRISSSKTFTVEHPWLCEVSNIRTCMFPMHQVWRVSCGWRHCAFISWHGALFTWGDGEGGRLGQGEAGTNSFRSPLLMLSLSCRVSMFVCILRRCSSNWIASACLGFLSCRLNTF